MGPRWPGFSPACPVHPDPPHTHPTAGPAIGRELPRPARPSAGQARLSIPTLPPEPPLPREAIYHQLRGHGRGWPPALPVLLRRYKNHLKGHFVSRQRCFHQRRREAAEATRPQASFPAPSWTGSPRTSAAGVQSPIARPGGPPACRLHELEGSPMPPNPTNPRLSACSSLSACALLRAWHH